MLKIDGKVYISIKRASELCECSTKEIAFLCGTNKLENILVGKNIYVARNSAIGYSRFRRLTDVNKDTNIFSSPFKKYSALQFMHKPNKPMRDIRAQIREYEKYFNPLLKEPQNKLSGKIKKIRNMLFGSQFKNVAILGTVFTAIIFSFSYLTLYPATYQATHNLLLKNYNTYKMVASGFSQNIDKSIGRVINMSDKNYLSVHSDIKTNDVYLAKNQLAQVSAVLPTAEENKNNTDTKNNKSQFINFAYLQIVDGEVKNGDIVAVTPDESVYHFAKISDADKLIGVVNDNALFVVDAGESGIPVVHSGTVLMNVIMDSDPIDAGDLISLSDFPGKGQKYVRGTNTNAIIGVALETFKPTTRYTSTDSSKNVYGGLLTVELAVGSELVSSLIAQLNDNKGTDIELGNTTEYYTGYAKFFVTSVQYITAIALFATALFFAYSTYQKYIITGLQSVGRNPLAKATINRMMLYNIIFITVISMSAIVLSIYVLSL